MACWQHKNQEDELQLVMICKTLVVLPGFGNIVGSIAFKPAHGQVAWFLRMIKLTAKKKEQACKMTQCCWALTQKN